MQIGVPDGMPEALDAMHVPGLPAPVGFNRASRCPPLADHRGEHDATWGFRRAITRRRQGAMAVES